MPGSKSKRWCKCTVCLANSDRGALLSPKTIRLHTNADKRRTSAALVVAATAAAASAAASVAVAAVAASAAASHAAALAIHFDAERAAKRQRVHADDLQADVEVDDEQVFGDGGQSFDEEEEQKNPPEQASSSNNSIQSGELSEPDPEFEDLLEDHAPSVQLPSLVAPPVDDPIAAASDIPADVPSPKRRTLLQKATEDCAKPLALGTIIPNALIGEVLNCGIRHGATQRMQTDLFEILRRYVSPVIPSFSIAQRMAENRSYVSINDFPVCPKECSIYKKRFADITQAEMASICCPICGDLYIQHIKMVQYKPIKVFFFLGLKDRLRDLLEDPRFSRKMRLPNVTVAPEDRVGEARTVKNVWDSQGWWNHVVQGQGRTGEPPDVGFGTERNRRNIVVSINIDGFKPFKRVNSSMLPYVYQILNLPEDLRYRPGFLILAALHPGRKKPLNYATHLQLIVDELNELWTKGVEFDDPEMGGARNFARVKLLFTVADYPAHCDNNCQQGAMAYYGCVKCNIRAQPKVGKQAMEYDQYLAFAHGNRPHIRTHDSIQLNAEQATDAIRERGEVDGQKTFGVVGRSPLFDLPYFDMVLHTPLDMMHLTSGVIGRHLVGMLSGERLTNAKRSANSHAAKVAVAKEKADDVAVAKVATINEEIKQLEIKQAHATLKINKNKFANQIIAKKNERSTILHGAIQVHGPGPEEAAAAAHAESDHLLALANMPWNMTDAEALQIERVAYREIRAPSGVAPHSKRPLSCSSEMTAHHWMNFVKVYGKYLLACKYTGDCLRVACKLLEFVKDCMLSSHPHGKVKEIIVRAKQLAKELHRYFPHTERSMVLHLLVFHMPQTMGYWGPSRGFWAFVFERNIGRLARSIRSRKHPARNLLNEYIRHISAHMLTIPPAEDDPEEEDDEVEEVYGMDRNDDNKHPLTPLGAIICSTTTVNHIVFPTYNRYSSKYIHDKMDVRNVFARVIRPTLGEVICSKNRKRGCNDFTFSTTTRTVLAGMWRYNCSEKEDKSVSRVTCSSWFCMEMQYLPHPLYDAAAQAARPDLDVRLVYGRFRHFGELYLPNWISEDQQHYLGHCTLYETGVYNIEANLSYVDLTRPLMLRIDGKPVTTSYINLKFIKTQVAVAPAIDSTNPVLAPIRGRFVVMPLQK